MTESCIALSFAPLCVLYSKCQRCTDPREPGLFVLCVVSVSIVSVAMLCSPLIVQCHGPEQWFMSYNAAWWRAGLASEIHSKLPVRWPYVVSVIKLMRLSAGFLSGRIRAADSGDGRGKRISALPRSEVYHHYQSPPSAPHQGNHGTHTYTCTNTREHTRKQTFSVM